MLLRKVQMKLCDTKKTVYLIGEKKTGEKWPNFVLGDRILTGLKF